MSDLPNNVSNYAPVSGLSGVFNLKVDYSKIYTVNPFNWYKLKPYSFAYYPRGSQAGKGSLQVTMALPIAPSNLTVTTHFATNIITTLYGVVEEHSEIRYYDIVIQGTTGYAPTNYKPIGAITDIKNPNSAKAMASKFKKKGLTVPSGSQTAPGRQAFDYEPLFQLGGFAQQTVGVINTFNDQANELTNGVVNETGIDPEQSGYIAFHNLYRLLQSYKRGAAAIDSDKPFLRHPLQFLNYKDGIKYDVVPRTFQLVRSADSPMLYNYNIVLKAFNLRNVDALDVKADITTDKLNDLGLDGISGSLFNQFQDLCGGAASLVGTATSGLGALGG